MSQRFDELDETDRRLVAIAAEAGCVEVDPETGRIDGLYDPDAEELTYRRVAAAVRRGEFGFVDRDEVMERIESIVSVAHPQIED